MGQHTYGEIPDHFRTKKSFPLGQHIWKVFQELGWEYWLVGANALKESRAVYNLFKDRLDASILAARAVIDEKVEDPSRLMAYSLFGPIPLYIPYFLYCSTNLLIMNAATPTIAPNTKDDAISKPEPKK